MRLIVQDRDLAGEIRAHNGIRTLLRGEVIGNDLFWTVDTIPPMTFSASIVDDTMTGDVQLGDFGDITFVGTYTGQYC